MKNTISFTVLLYFCTITFTATAQITPSPTVRTEQEINPQTYTGIISENYPNGKPKLWKNVINGKANGLWLEWYANGELRYRAYWKDSKGHGKWEYFYSDGTLRSVSVYQNDIPIGLSRTYHPNGQLASETTYVDGKKNGIVYTYDTQGTLISSQLYADNEAVLNKPILFEVGKIATAEHNEWDISFMPDGRTLYFVRREAGKTQQQIFSAQLKDKKWTKPLPVFSEADDVSVFISADGQRMYSSSFRALPTQPKQQDFDSNIWYRERKGNTWSLPIPLGPNINKVMQKTDQWPTNYEGSPSTDPAGNLYFWTKGSGKSPADIYWAKRKPDGSFADPVALDTPPNGKGYDVSPVVSPDGQYLFFASSDRSDRYGGEDLYYCKKTKTGWSTPQNLGPDINTERFESFPRFSPDGKYFFFASDQAKQKDAAGEYIWSIYYMETRFLDIN